MSVGAVSAEATPVNSGLASRRSGPAVSPSTSADTSDLQQRLQRIKIMVEVLERPEIDFEGQVIDELA